MKVLDDFRWVVELFYFIRCKFGCRVVKWLVVEVGLFGNGYDCNVRFGL